MSDTRPMLKVDLSSGAISREALPEQLCREYLGGEGINARLLWEHFLKVDPHVDPRGPENVLILGIGPMAGTCLGAGSKMKFTFKSPAYHIYGDSTSGGHLGPQLRWAGYDHIVITGRAEHPVYLAIDDDRVAIKDARHIWGTTVPQAYAAIRQELGGGEVDVACIGQAGENVVPVASIMVSIHRAAGRGGGGCVMGSKNLKAIAGRGTKGLAVHDSAALIDAADEFLARNKDNPKHERYMRFGTLASTRGFHAVGADAYRNHQGRMTPEHKIAKLDHHWYRENLLRHASACSPGCNFGCTHWGYIKGTETPTAPRFAGRWSLQPEFGAANPFGTSCDCPDLVAVAHFGDLANEYGIDTMEIGMGLSFLMELWQRGIIDERDTRRWTGEPLSLDWGNQETMERLIEATALQSNDLGRMLQLGVYRAALAIGEDKGVDVRQFAAYGKAGATHEGPIRGQAALSMAAAVASIGAHHLKGRGLDVPTSMAYFGRPEAGDPYSPVLKGAGQAISESLFAVTNSLGMCYRLSAAQFEVAPLDLISRAVDAVTGLGLSPDDLVRAGERVVNIQKAFNSRLGLRREDDTLCHRWLNEPQLEGPGKGNRAGSFLEAAKDEYYQWHGWDVTTGLQPREKLIELGLADVAEVLERDNGLAKAELAAGISPDCGGV